MREPSGPRSRPTDEMHQPNLDHPTHDLTLVAAHAAGDIAESDRPRADALLASCRHCAELHDDLLAIATATRTLAPPIARARDFQLEPAHADHLRRGSWLRRVLRPFGTASTATRPLAAAFTALGVAGLLVGALLPSLLGGGAMSGPGRDLAAGSTTGQQAATTAPEAVPGVPAPQAAASSTYPAAFGANNSASGAPEDSGTTVKAGPAESERARVSNGVQGGNIASGGTAVGVGADDGSSAQRALTEPAAPNLVLIGSLALLGLGLALFGLRFAGRRLR
jgi:hypothetical protein